MRVQYLNATAAWVGGILWASATVLSLIAAVYIPEIFPTVGYKSDSDEASIGRFWTALSHLLGLADRCVPDDPSARYLRIN